MAGAEGSLECLDLPLHEAIGSGEVGRESGVVDVLLLEKLLEFVRSKWKAIVGINSAWGSILGN